MNEQENIQIARKAYQLFSQGDIEGILELYAIDVEFIFPGPPDQLPIAGTYRGKDQLRNFFGLVNQHLAFDSFEPREFLAQGDLVVVLGHDRGQVRSTGKAFDEDWVHVARIRDGKLSHWQAFMDTARMAADFSPAEAQPMA